MKTKQTTKTNITQTINGNTEQTQITKHTTQQKTETLRNKTNIN